MSGPTKNGLLRAGVACVLALTLLAPLTASADHAPPGGFTPDEPLGTATNSGGDRARWKLITTIPTGNPQTDLDFFTKGGQKYASVGTLGAGLNEGGQTIIRLTRNGRVSASTVEYVSGHPSASCVSDPSAALGLQHDVEATPKGKVILSSRNRFADRRSAQLIIDATDNPGRCHDNGAGAAPPLGGLELVDITDIQNPKEIHLTSHIGEAHTVNVDPKRPHIAYAVTSDAVTVSDNSTPNNRSDDFRENRVEGDSDAFDLDGFEVVDLSSCMNFPSGTSLADKRSQCRPDVYRYRYPGLNTALGHTLQTGTGAVYGCHELEVYANDRLTCASGNAALLLNMRNAFNDRGTPNNFRDDKPRGTPLPCSVRASTSDPLNQTGAMVTDCVTGAGGVDLKIPNWLDIGSPSLEGVRVIGAAHHQGRGAGGAATPAYDSTQDIDFNHESELTRSGKFIIATDERGGGVLPPGASCDEVDGNKAGNGGLHAYAVKRLSRKLPGSARKAFRAYARTPKGKKAIYRAKVRTGAEGAFCTAHVFQQVAGQNRIFMGWYTQGTQVVDFLERNGKFIFQEAGWFIPENANTWTSHIFKMKANRNGSFTYWGATGDFNLATDGRNAIDVYKVKLPRPPISTREACNKPRAIVGTPRSDVLRGTKRIDIICGLGGNDIIRGRAGGDILIGGRGRDRITGRRGWDDIRGGAGGDQLRAGKGADEVDGGPARDTCFTSGRDRSRKCERRRTG